VEGGWGGGGVCPGEGVRLYWVRRREWVVGWGSQEHNHAQKKGQMSGDW